MERLPGFDGHWLFRARFDSRCRSCGNVLRAGDQVLGRKDEAGRWDVVCVPCATVPSQTPEFAAEGRVPGPRPSPARTPWSMLVEYLRSCVVDESLSPPVPLGARDRWASFPLDAETVLCGPDTTLPAPEPVRDLFGDLKDLEGVFYGWPAVVVVDSRRRPHIAPLFVRALNPPVPAGDGEFTVSVQGGLPRLNHALLRQEWFAPELLADAAAVIAGNVIGFGASEAMKATVRMLTGALGIPDTVLDPLLLGKPPSEQQPWRPQEAGVFNLAIAVKGQLDHAVQGLLKDLDQMAGAGDWEHSAARFLFQDHHPAHPQRLTSSAVRLNHAQELALATASASPLTVITGPPGTGKSQTVTAILAEAWVRGESAVLCSSNNKPVDDVVNSKAASVDPALVLRTGNADKRAELAATLRELVDEVSSKPEGAGFAGLAGQAAARYVLVDALARKAELERDLYDSSVRRDQLLGSIWGDRPPPPPGRWAKITRKAARAAATRWRWLRRRRSAKLRELAAVSNPAVTAEQLVEWCQAESRQEYSAHAVRTFREQYGEDLTTRLAEIGEAWQSESKALVNETVRRAVTDGAEDLLALGDGLSGGERLWSLMTRALTHAKGWATTALSVRSNFPCRAGVLDLVVIDEASQCTLAQVLPLAYRAKRLVIVGDPEQLPPVVTADPAQLRVLAAQAGLDHDQLAAAHHTYGEDSAFSAFAARFRPEPLLLDEHYRCHPDIIRFCNEEFYRGRLTVLTRVDGAGELPRGLAWRQVAGRTERGRSGSAINRAEAESIVDWLRERTPPAAEVGVVTPFRAQAMLIKQLLGQTGLDGVEVGTAHTFQGGEREVILFSTVISAGASPGTIGWLESQRSLVNVAASRARRELVVFGDRAALAGGGPETLRKLAELASAPRRPVPARADGPVERLYAMLVARGVPVRLGETAEGYPIALAVDLPDGGRADIEVTYFPGGDPDGRVQRALHTRDENLRRLGWRVVRVPAWRAYLEPEAVVACVGAAPAAQSAR